MLWHKPFGTVLRGMDSWIVHQANNGGVSVVGISFVLSNLFLICFVEDDVRGLITPPWWLCFASRMHAPLEWLSFHIYVRQVTSSQGVERAKH